MIYQTKGLHAMRPPMQLQRPEKARRAPLSIAESYAKSGRIHRPSQNSAGQA